MDLIVEGLSSEAAGIGLAEQSIQNVIESRLRSARLYDPDADTILSANIAVLRQAFSISLQYYRPVRVLESGPLGVAVTWDKSGVGTHGSDAHYILSGIRRYMDQFLTEYLRANEEAC